MLTMETLVTYSVVSLGDAVTVLVNFSVIGGEVLVTTTVTGVWPEDSDPDPVSDPDPEPDPEPDPDPEPEPESEPPDPLPPSMGTTE